MIYAVLTQYPFCGDLCTFVWSKYEQKCLICGAKITNMMWMCGSLLKPFDGEKASQRETECESV